jgi:hypothetical protein
MAITRERWEELKALCDAASEGPWEVVELEGYCYLKTGGSHGDVFSRKYKENHYFIAAARTALPELIKEVERLKRMEQIMVACGHWVVDTDKAV